MFDQTKETTLNGKLKELQWTNPHIWVQVMAPDPATGKDVEWSIEGGSPNNLARKGWSRNVDEGGRRRRRRDSSAQERRAWRQPGQGHRQRPADPELGVGRPQQGCAASLAFGPLPSGGRSLRAIIRRLRARIMSTPSSVVITRLERDRPSVARTTTLPGRGVAATAAAFLIWGLFPLYIVGLSSVSALQITAHRVAWSCVFVLALLAFRRELGSIAEAVKRPGVLLRLAGSAILVSVNWLAFVVGREQQPDRRSEPRVLHQPAAQRGAGDPRY